MSIRQVFFPGEFQQFQTFCNGTNVLDALGGDQGIFYTFIIQLLRHGGLCITINLPVKDLDNNFVHYVPGGNPAQNRVPDEYYADIFIYLTNDVQVNQYNQPIRNSNFLPDNHIHIYPCEEVSTYENRTGCKNGGIECSFSTNLQGVKVGWKRKNGNLGCGQGALCGILYLSSNLDQLMFTAASCAHDFYEELMNPGTHPANRINIGFTDENYTFRRTSSPSVSKKGGRKSPKKGGRKSPKKGGRKSPKKGGRKSPKKGGRKSPKKGGRKSPKKGKKSVEAKRKANYNRVISRRRRKTIAAAVSDTNTINLQTVQMLYQNIPVYFSPRNIPEIELRLVYILLYNPELLNNPQNAIIEATQLTLDKIYQFLQVSNTNILNCGGKIFGAQKQPEYCGNCVPNGDHISLNLDNMLTGSILDGRGTCTYKEHSNVLWHTHPLTSRPWPSGEDIAKVIKSRHDVAIDKIPIVSLIFTKWGLWEIVTAINNKINIDDNTVTNINNLGGKIFEEKWKRNQNNMCLDDFTNIEWRQSIVNRINDYIVNLATHIDVLNPNTNGGGFIRFSFWDEIAYANFQYQCYIPNSNIQNIMGS